MGAAGCVSQFQSSDFYPTVVWQKDKKVGLLAHSRYSRDFRMHLLTSLFLDFHARVRRICRPNWPLFMADPLCIVGRPFILLLLEADSSSPQMRRVHVTWFQKKNTEMKNAKIGTGMADDKSLHRTSVGTL